MNNELCPHCGAETDGQEICPSCGQPASDAGANDLFAAAMKQEQHSRKQQADLRKKFRQEPDEAETPDLPRQAPESVQDAAPEAEEAAEETAAPAKAVSRKSFAALLYPAVFVFLLLVICAGVYGMTHKKTRPPKNDSYAFYGKGRDLWFYSGQQRKSILLSSANIPAVSDIQQAELEYLYDTLTAYDAKHEMIWYPLNLNAAHDTCTIAYRSLSAPEREVPVAEISLKKCLFSRSIIYNYAAMWESYSMSKFSDNLSPCLFAGDMLYFVNTDDQFCVWKDGTVTKLADSVYRFWKGTDNKTVIYLVPEIDDKGREVYSYYQNNMTYEEPPVSCKLYCKDGVLDPQLIASDITSWNQPEPNTPDLFHFVQWKGMSASLMRFNITTAELRLINNHETENMSSKTQDENKPDWRTCLLRCYPNGDSIILRTMAPLGQIDGYYSSSVYISDMSDPESDSTGVLYYDAKKNTCTRLNEAAVYAYMDSLVVCDNAPYYYLSDRRSLIYKDSLFQTIRQSSEQYISCSFSPSGTYVICAEHTYSSSYPYTTDVRLRLGRLHEADPVTFFDIDDFDTDTGRIFWHPDQDTQQDIFMYTNPHNQLISGQEVLNQVNGALCKDYPEFNRFYAVSNYDGICGTGGTLNSMHNNQWQPLADNVTDYIPVAQDMLYLLCAKDSNELHYVQDGKQYTVGKADVLLHAECCQPD